MAGRFSWARCLWRQQATVFSLPSFLDCRDRACRLLGIIVSATLSTVLALIQAAGTSGFQSFYSFVVGLGTMTAVIPYAFCALAPGLIAGHGPSKTVPRVSIVEIIAFIFAVFTLYGCGAEAVLYGTVLLVLGIPVYVWERRRASDSSGAAGRSLNPPDL